MALEETEVCVVGAGAAGGIMAFELARRGFSVVVLESGPRHDFSKRFEYARRLLKGENPWESRLPGLDTHTTAGSEEYSLHWRRARGVGGSTLHWEGYTTRFQVDDFRQETVHGVARDWPISYNDLEPYYVKAEVALGVAGEGNDPWVAPRSGPFPLPAFEHSYSDGFFAAACGKLGIGISKLPQARNSIAYGGRVRCAACGTCHVCPTGAKASTELTHIPQAEATGKARVITDANVLRIETDGARKVTLVRYAGPDKKERTLGAEVFVVAAGGIETPRLLLLSQTSTFSQGLANRSGLVGKCFMTQPVIEVTGRVKENLFPYRVGFSTAISRQFERERRRGEGAYFLEFLNSAGYPPQWIALTSGKTGAALRKHIEEEFGRTAGIRVYGEQLPVLGNSVSLDPQVRDCFGSPVPRITYSVGEFERKARQAGAEAARKILAEMGATDIRVVRPNFAAHQIGTHRMGDDPQTSVVDRNLKAHDLDNLYLVGAGCFPTATCTHPTLTVSALAIRAAEQIASLRPPRNG